MKEPDHTTVEEVSFIQETHTDQDIVIDIKGIHVLETDPQEEFINTDRMQLINTAAELTEHQ